MKILFINSVVGFGSTGKIVETLYKEATREGHICKVAYGRDNTSDIEDENLIKIGNNIGFKLHVLKSRLTDKSGFYSNIATKNFINDVIRFDPDIIHLHNLHGYYLNIEILFNYIKKYNKKIIWTLHDCWAFTGHCSHFSFANCKKWIDGCYDCPLTKEYPKAYVDNSKDNWRIKSRVFTDVNNLTIVTPSRWLKEMTQRSFLKHNKIEVIPNGIDLGIFKYRNSNFRKKYKLENRIIILGCATSWNDKKGLNDFISLSYFLDDNYKIVLVGLDKKNIKNIPNNVLALPITNSREELAEIYSQSDVFFNPSREETMGMTTVEAMACNTPVLVSNFTAVPEVVNEKSGLILEKLDTESILEGINKIIKNNSLSPREQAMNYDLNKQYKKYVELYGMEI